MLFIDWLGFLHDWRTSPPAKLFSSMCFSPLRIKNPKYNPVKGMDSDFLLVPCGHCPECRMHKQDDWYVRSFFEFDDIKKRGGYCQAITLTYRETSLPHCTSYNIPCFSRTHIKNFLKLVRDKVGDGLRFFMACEYGDEKHRPHYHFLFFSPFSISRSLLLSAVAKSWHYGIIYTTNINDGLITDVRGIRYVAKYCAKDVCQDDWYMEQRKKVLGNFRFVDTNCPNSPEHERYLKELKDFERCRPFIQSSMNYGITGLDSITRSNLIDGYFRLPSYSRPEGDKFKVPLYYERKLLFNVVFLPGKKSPVYKLNEYGVDIHCCRFKKKVDALSYRVKTVRNIVGSFGFRSFCSNYSKYTCDELTSALTVSRDFLSLYCVLSPYYTCLPTVEMPLDYAFLDYIPYIDYKQHFIDKIYYDSSLASEFNPLDGSLFEEVGLDFLQKANMVFSCDYFRFFHQLFTDSQEYLCKLENERQRFDENLAIQQKIYKRRTMRKKQKNYVK